MAKQSKALKKVYKKTHLVKSQVGLGRSYTTYTYFDNQGKVRQGPHTTAHCYTKSAAEKIFNNIKNAKKLQDLRFLADTRLIPSPGKANAILVEKLAKSNQLKSTINQRRKYLKNYVKNYNKFLEATSRQEQYKYMRKLIELSPQQTYAWDKGSYTSAQIAGGGESMNAANKDYLTLDDLKNQKISLDDNKIVKMFKDATKKGFKSIDYDPKEMSPTDLRRIVKRTIQYNKAVDDETMSTVSQKSYLDIVQKQKGKYFVP